MMSESSDPADNTNTPVRTQGVIKAELSRAQPKLLQLEKHTPQPLSQLGIKAALLSPCKSRTFIFIFWTKQACFTQPTSKKCFLFSLKALSTSMEMSTVK